MSASPPSLAVVGEVLAAALALLAGYLVGSIPAARLIARSAGVDAPIAGDDNPDSAGVSQVAGSGWGLLALSADLAKGVIPVAVGMVTWSWAVGWLAGLGAVLGACWPAFGRFPGGRGVATLGGAAIALAPLAGLVSVALILLVLAVGRLVGRDARVAAIATGFATYPPLSYAVGQDVVRLCALLVLYLVVLVRYATTSRR